MSTEENSAATGSGDDQPKESSRPKNVPLRLWEKFQALEKRTNEVTKRSTDKRIKHLQKTALENVARALHDPADQALVNLPPVTSSDLSTPGHHLHHSPSTSSSSTPSSSTSGSSSVATTSTTTPAAAAASRKRSADDALKAGTCQEDGPSKEKHLTGGEEKEWEAVRGLMGVNDHLAGVSHGPLGPRTVLELQIDDAIAGGEFKRAEDLSDYMATREFGEKVAKAIDAKNFLDHKQKEEEVAKVKRKKKLNWGFEPKHRWETKGNM